jgi:hypothetical protein
MGRSEPRVAEIAERMVGEVTSEEMAELEGACVAAGLLAVAQSPHLVSNGGFHPGWVAIARLAQVPFDAGSAREFRARGREEQERSAVAERAWTVVFAMRGRYGWGGDGR